jgi:chromosome segregation ATPase
MPDPAPPVGPEFLERLHDLLGKSSEIAATVVTSVQEFAEHRAHLTATRAELQSILADTKTAMASMSADLPKKISDEILPRLDQVSRDQMRIRAEIMERIDRLQGTVELVREDGRVNWTTADTALNRAKNYREEIDNLTTTLSAMERRYQTLMSMVQELRDEKKPPPQASQTG